MTQQEREARQRLRVLRKARRLAAVISDKLEEVGAMLDEVSERPAADCFYAGSLDMGRLVDALTKRVRPERARSRVRAAGIATV
jgi:hypothetical protein